MGGTKGLRSLLLGWALPAGEEVTGLWEYPQPPAGPVRNVAHVAAQGDPLPLHHETQYNTSHRPCQQKNRRMPLHFLDFRQIVTSRGERALGAYSLQFTAYGLRLTAYDLQFTVYRSQPRVCGPPRPASPRAYLPHSPPGSCIRRRFWRGECGQGNVRKVRKAKKGGKVKCISRVCLRRLDRGGA